MGRETECGETSGMSICFRKMIESRIFGEHAMYTLIPALYSVDH
jgi:hypothetical protein